MKNWSGHILKISKMKYRFLGRTGLEVSRLCFGALTIGPLQANLPLDQGAAVIKEALDAGVNFIDTAELYHTYGYIREALQGFAGKEDVIIASKSYAYSREAMRCSLEKACHELGRDYVDIFLLHEQTSRLTLKGHQDALSYLAQAKKQGMVRAAGVSTHTVEVVRAAALYDEIDVIHPILNMHGIGICDGTVQEMLEAISFASSMGKGIYTMKALGGGHLSQHSQDALAWVLKQPAISAIAVGMQSGDEVALNCALFTGQPVNKCLLDKVTARRRRLLVEDWCQGCGKCAAKCPMGAITIDHNKAIPNMQKCVLCGYCGAHCPEFCLKIV